MTRRRKKMSRDFDDLLDDLLEAPMDALDRAMESLDDAMESLDDKLDAIGERSKKKRGQRIRFTDKSGAKVTVDHDGSSDNMSIRTDGDIDLELINEIRQRIRGESKWDKMKPRSTARPRTRRQHESAAGMKRPWFWSRNWRGEPKEPIELRPDAHVAVATGGMFGRKYTVEIDGTTVYMLKIEELMARYYGDNLVQTFVASLEDNERTILKKIIDGLQKLGIAEKHHIEISSKLGKIIDGLQKLGEISSKLD